MRLSLRFLPLFIAVLLACGSESTTPPVIEPTPPTSHVMTPLVSTVAFDGEVEATDGTTLVPVDLPIYSDRREWRC